VSFEPDGTGCPSGYVDLSSAATVTVVDSTGVGPAVCSCTCSGDPTCQGRLTRCNDSYNLNSHTDFCAGISYNPSQDYTYRLTTSELGSSCSATPDTQVPSYDGGEARLCEADGLSICPGERLCLPAPNAGARTCIVNPQAGQTCPSGYEAVDVATGADDTRGCSACSCGGSCTGGAMAYYTATSCGGTRHEIPNDGACHTLPSANYRSARIEGVSESCQPTGGEPEGELVLTRPGTLCCESGG
jgi:hypothetical protein